MFRTILTPFFLQRSSSREIVTVVALKSLNGRGNGKRNDEAKLIDKVRVMGGVVLGERSD